jgi:hypothetical protein
VPPQGLIPNRRRKPTPSIASTSNTTSTTTDPNYEEPAANAGSNVDRTHVLKPTLDLDSKAEPVGSVQNLFNGIFNNTDNMMTNINERLADHNEN